tara:strand:+ start:46 stop:303 length:258 start_codon:yes stop_codon:yes gene_type:complete
MSYFVYLLVSTKKSRVISYVGYTNNLKKRLSLHNKGKGAKFTRGSSWKMIYKKKYTSKQEAMSEEYKLKKNYKLRNKMKIKFYSN